MNIEKHIIDLLYYHDCVILPEFGGFVVNYQEAQIDFQQQKLSPPARVLAFNQSLTINDGLLINAVSQLEKISYEEAANAVSEYVKQLQNELKNNSALNIENIGKFSFTNNIIEFHPTGNHNFLLGSYGLSDFHYPMLRTPKPQQIVEEAKKEIVDKIINNKTRKPSWGIAIPVAAASIALAVLFFNQTHIPKTNLTNNQMSSISIPSITSDKSSASLEYNTVNEDIANSSDNIEVNEIEEIATIEETVIENHNSGNIHIIAGCFSVQDNANAMVNKFIESGYSARIIDSNDNLHRVSIKSYNNLSDAINEINQLKEDTNNQSLWILER